MKRNLFLSLAAGLVGGLLSHYMTTSTVFAQAQAPKEVRAQSLTLVDGADHILGTFTSAPALPGRSTAPGQPRPVRIVLKDSDGLEIWSAGGPMVAKPAMDQRGLHGKERSDEQGPFQELNQRQVSVSKN